MGIIKKLMGLEISDARFNRYRRRDSTSGLIRALKYGEYNDVKARAAFELGKRHKNRKVAKVLLSLLVKDSSWEEYSAYPVDQWSTSRDNKYDSDVRCGYTSRLGYAITEALMKMGQVEEHPLPLDHPNVFVREACARILGSVDMPDRETALARLLADPLRQVQAATILALRNIHLPFVVEQLKGIVSGPNHSLRDEAIHAMGKTMLPQAHSFLVDLLFDCDPWVRKTAANALSEGGWQPANTADTAQLLYARGDWCALAFMGDPRATEGIESLIRELTELRYISVGVGDDIEKASVRQREHNRKVVDSLAKIGPPAVEGLVKVFYLDYNFMGIGDYGNVYSYNHEAIQNISRVLVCIGKSAVAPLLEVLRADRPWAFMAARALLDIGDPDTIPDVHRWLSGEEKEIRMRVEREDGLTTTLIQMKLQKEKEERGRREIAEKGCSWGIPMLCKQCGKAQPSGRSKCSECGGTL